jgi:tryptophan halogenase
MMQNGEFTFEEFLEGTDAAFKYGVMYENWSKNTFLHYFKDPREFDFSNSRFGLDSYGRLLANKDKSTHIHELMGKQLFESVKNNDVMLDQDMFNHSFHFDASHFISFFQKNAVKHPKVTYIDDKIIGGLKEEDRVKYIIGEETGIINSDFFIFATGDYKINEEFLNIRYKDYSNILLTNRAAAYPLKYEDKEKEFHPYTVARTMTSGWRWITPTWSRIGTGYVFSNNHISEDQAIDELRKNIGKDVDPFIVNFSPRHNEKDIHENWATVGMASGFLEPLDAPGLSMTIGLLMHQITHYLYYIENNKNESKSRIIFELEKLNNASNENFDFWCIFILSQYKTCHREDTKFWQDHKNVKWEKYDNFIKNIDEFNPQIEKMMVYQTMAAKDLQWNSSLKSKPYPGKTISFTPINHFKFIESLKNKSAFI